MHDKPIELVISATGTVRCIYHEEMEFDALGDTTITRASHVEPTKDARWTADLTPVGGPVLGPFPFRSHALSIERRWLESQWLASSKHSSESDSKSS